MRAEAAQGGMGGHQQPVQILVPGRNVVEDLGPFVPRLARTIGIEIKVQAEHMVRTVDARDLLRYPGVIEPMGIKDHDELVHAGGDSDATLIGFWSSPWRLQSTPGLSSLRFGPAYPYSTAST